MNYILDFLSIFINELALVPIKEIWKNSKGSSSSGGEGRGVTMSMLPNTSTKSDNRPSSIIREVGKYVRNSLVRCTERLRVSPPPEEMPIFRDEPPTMVMTPEEGDHHPRERRVNQACGAASIIWQTISKDKLDVPSQYSVAPPEPNSPTGPGTWDPWG